MYLWKVDELVKDFRLGRVTQLEEFKYMLLFTIAMTLGSDPMLYDSTSYNMYDLINTVLFTVISVLGLFYCYKVNKRGDDKEYIARVMCIGLPVLIRIVILFIPIFILLAFIEDMVFEIPIEEESDTYETSLLEVIALNVSIAAYYYYLSLKLSAVSEKNA